MRKLKVLPIVLLIFFVQISYAQREFTGKVLEVIDGKTIVIEVATTKNKFKAQLDFIEIPEPEQALYQTVKDHLSELVLGKDVTFTAHLVQKDKIIGQVLLSGVDLSQQIVRDGAGWYSISDKNRLTPSENESYEMMQNQAQAEKRGVWGVENLKPAWIFRAEKENAARQSQMSAPAENTAPISKPIKPNDKPPAKTELWAEVSGANEKKYMGIDGLLSVADDKLRVKMIYTNANMSAINNKTNDLADMRALYLYRGSDTTVETDVFLLGFLIKSPKYRFANTQNLTITIGKQKVALRLGKRLSESFENGVGELLLFRINRKTIEQIAASKSASAKIDGYTIEITPATKAKFEKLLNVTN